MFFLLSGKKMNREYAEIMEIEALSKINRAKRIAPISSKTHAAPALSEAEKIALWTEQVKEMPPIRMEEIEKETACSLHDLAQKLAKEI